MSTTNRRSTAQVSQNKPVDRQERCIQFWSSFTGDCHRPDANSKFGEDNLYSRLGESVDLLAGYHILMENLVYWYSICSDFLMISDDCFLLQLIKLASMRKKRSILYLCSYKMI